MTCRSFGRLWLGGVVAHGLAAPSLLISLGGFSLPAHAGEGVPAIELCLHDADGAPLSPPGNADHSGCTHCIFSLAGSHAVIGTSPAVCYRVGVAIVVLSLRADTHGLPP